MENVIVSNSHNIPPPIAIIGAGAWGSALAIHLARKGQEVRLWAYEREQIIEINATRINARYLPAVIFPPNIHCSDDYQTVLSGVQDILIVVPSAVFHANLVKLKPFLQSNQRLLWASKGLDTKKHQLLNEVVREILGDKEMAVLSGPSFAKEVAMGLPTAINIASENYNFAHDLLLRFQTKCFRVEITSDIIGVELGGAMKNVLAIAVGITEGLGFGANAKAAVITYGLSEMIELGVVLGAKQETFLGLSGLGDLVLTCTDNQSRNRRLGLALGRGQTLEETKKLIGTTEGYDTAKNIFYLLEKYAIKAPFCEGVYRILYEKKSPHTLFKTLFNE
ncbi:MAG: NAD(P)-dependent glycerol-3-phosphate dehydrogenase [Candidatus Aquirickettsiella gammari]|uniref:Glycerol-3-phosphate dehydrogenase [NAD(P)+] n=1 Tax=Candidatus Aquirickettsiella gammari TaxID=2016198 RepID=A0A370CJZ2_9COXI|nr:MAG: NAD(P)-dependent glycerol-3-phosphate dehydrogenase [Candidatus Aquirickettsiella gammari]